MALFSILLFFPFKFLLTLIVKKNQQTKKSKSVVGERRILIADAAPSKCTHFSMELN